MYDKMMLNTATSRFFWDPRHRHILDADLDIESLTIAQADDVVMRAAVPPERFDDAVEVLSSLLAKLRGSYVDRAQVEAHDVYDWRDRSARHQRLCELDYAIDECRTAILNEYRKALQGDHPESRSAIVQAWTTALLEDYTNTAIALNTLRDNPDANACIPDHTASTGARLRALHQVLTRRIAAL